MIVNPPAHEEAGYIGRMVGTLSHRGPDSTSLKSLRDIQMGHARLSVIDLVTGTQPMCDVTGRYWIVFNGEIYNYRELRTELVEKGHRFATQSDTEVILASHMRWGEECIQRFRGMFAFAIWDTQEQSLFAARDLFGEKPLYYARSRDGLLVSSEIKGLLASGLVTREIDSSSIDAYLAFGYIPPDRTVYKGISTLPPAHFLTFRRGEVRLERYWVPRLDEQVISLDAAAERLSSLLDRAVERQMVADVPVGAFLSGGLDSSTIVALMGQHSDRPVLTFSAGFGTHINELPYARAVADKYGTDHHELDFGAPDVAPLLVEMAGIYDEPFADTSNIPTFLISRFAKQHVKVVLSGDGGDELFGGYWWYAPLARSETLSPSYLKWMVLRLFATAFSRGDQNLQRHAVAQGWATRYQDMWTRDVMANVVFRPRERLQLWGGRRRGSELYQPGDYYKPLPSTSGMNRGFYFDLTSYLPGDILVKVDRAAMANGLETRAPFLDRDLAEFALSLPASTKVRGDETKIVLRHACERYWPDELRGRGKQGFGAPTSAWLSLPGVQALWARVLSEKSSLRRLLPGLKPPLGPRAAYQSWVLLVLGLWLERSGATV